MNSQRVLILGTRANPLSFFLSRSLNLRLNAQNVFVVDTEETRQQNRLPPIRDSFGCVQLPDLPSEDHLEQVVAENEITDIIDMTNAVAQADNDGSTKLEQLTKDVRLVQPIFTTCMDIKTHRAKRPQKHRPIMPGIIYPFQLTEYRFPCDLGTFLFWQGFIATQVSIDCKEIGIRGGQDLLVLCSALRAANHISDLIVEEIQSGSESAHSTSSESDSDEEQDSDLQAITISVQQLCHRLRKINHRFGYELINENDEWSEDHATDQLSRAKKQRIFCEDMLSDIIDWQQ